MSSSAPPPPPDVLDSSGAGAPPPPSGPAPRRRTLRRGLVAGGAVVLLGGAGYGAWAAYSFFQTGAQPAEALPASTLGYVSVDLDPSGGQKIAALRTLNKFPAFRDMVGVTSSDDLREKLFDAIQKDANCPGLDYAQDVKPWLGQRAAVAAVPHGSGDPVPVVVVQVTDDAKAEQGLATLRDCGGDGAHLGWHVDGDWAVLAEDKATADEVAADAAKDSLADDGDFKHWADEVGDPGVVSMYAAPAAGAYLADHVDQLQGLSSSLTGAAPLGGGFAASPVPARLTQQLRDFKGAAATIRFSDGGVELAVASDASASTGVLGASGGDSAGDLVGSLPTDTGAAFGLSLADGWFGDLLDQVATYSGESRQDLESQLEQASGLDLPGDVETLAGHALAVSVGRGLDPGTVMESGDPSDVPVAVKVEGDPDAITAVLAKLTDGAAGGLPPGLLDTDTSGDSVAIGPDAAYRQQVVGHGGLGDSSTFQDVVAEPDKARAVLFVDLDVFDPLIEQYGDGDVRDNLKPLKALGLSAWTDGDVAHAVLRVSTN